jgi:osmotically inducible lipoprotein OsmB
MKTIRFFCCAMTMAIGVITLYGCGTTSGAVVGGVAGAAAGGSVVSTVGGAVVGGVIGHEINK